jgi:hypothetical protein
MMMGFPDSLEALSAAAWLVWNDGEPFGKSAAFEAVMDVSETKADTRRALRFG